MDRDEHREVGANNSKCDNHYLHAWQGIHEFNPRWSPIILAQNEDLYVELRFKRYSNDEMVFMLSNWKPKKNIMSVRLLRLCCSHHSGQR